MYNMYTLYCSEIVLTFLTTAHLVSTLQVQVFLSSEHHETRINGLHVVTTSRLVVVFLSHITVFILKLFIRT